MLVDENRISIRVRREAGGPVVLSSACWCKPAQITSVMVANHPKVLRRPVGKAGIGTEPSGPEAPTASSASRPFTFIRHVPEVSGIDPSFPCRTILLPTAAGGDTDVELWNPPSLFCDSAPDRAAAQSCPSQLRNAAQPLGFRFRTELLFTSAASRMPAVLFWRLAATPPRRLTLSLSPHRRPVVPSRDHRPEVRLAPRRPHRHPHRTQRRQ